MWKPFVEISWEHYTIRYAVNHGIVLIYILSSHTIKHINAYLRVYDN